MLDILENLVTWVNSINETPDVDCVLVKNWKYCLMEDLIMKTVENDNIGIIWTDFSYLQKG